MKIQTIAYYLLTLVLIVIIIIYSQNFIIPIILALVLWYLINAVNQVFLNIPFIKRTIPKSILLLFSSLFIMTIIFSIGSLIGQTINSMASTAPNYQVNLEAQIQRISSIFGYTQEIKIMDIASDLDINSLLKTLLNSFRSLAQNFFLVLLYTLFLLIEQHTFPRKIAYLKLEKNRKELLSKVLDNINKSVRTYIGVKFAASIATGVLSYIVIAYAGLDYALFWAFVIFVFNFIPTIGSIAATILPCLIALVQFEELRPFFIILIGVGIIQLIIGGILEPKFYGDSLNISPFVIVVSLVMWGLLWGIVGMLLCVPITVILIHIFAHFEKTKPIAILLTQTGKIPN